MHILFSERDETRGAVKGKPLGMGIQKWVDSILITGYALETIEIKDQYNNTMIKLTRSLILTHSKNVLSP